MARFYSPTTAGFYDDRIHREMPFDAIAIADVAYADMLEGQAAGKLIVFADNVLALADALLPPPETKIPAGAFLDRFTLAEQLAIATAATGGAPMLLVALTKLGTTPVVNLESASLAGFIDVAVQAGAVAAERKAELIAPEPVTLFEAPAPAPEPAPVLMVPVVIAPDPVPEPPPAPDPAPAPGGDPVPADPAAPDPASMLSGDPAPAAPAEPAPADPAPVAAP